MVLTWVPEFLSLFRVNVDRTVPVKSETPTKEKPFFAEFPISRSGTWKPTCHITDFMRVFVRALRLLLLFYAQRRINVDLVGNLILRQYGMHSWIQLRSEEYCSTEKLHATLRWPSTEFYGTTAIFETNRTSSTKTTKRTHKKGISTTKDLPAKTLLSHLQQWLHDTHPVNSLLLILLLNSNPH